MSSSDFTWVSITIQLPKLHTELFPDSPSFLTLLCTKGWQQQSTNTIKPMEISKNKHRPDIIIFYSIKKTLKKPQLVARVNSGGISHFGMRTFYLIAALKEHSFKLSLNQHFINYCTGTEMVQYVHAHVYFTLRVTASDSALMWAAFEESVDTFSVIAFQGLYCFKSLRISDSPWSVLWPYLTFLKKIKLRHALTCNRKHDIQQLSCMHDSKTQKMIQLKRKIT